jgi:hypothetical protein
MLHPTVGRVLSAAGAVIAAVALFLVWYHVDRPASAGPTETTGWQTFTRLRWLVLAGAVLTLATALVAQVRAVLVTRTIVGLVVGALMLRRIISPPDLSADLDPQLGLWVGVAGALAIALGGLVDTGRRVVEAYPDLFRPKGLLGPGGGDGRAVEPRTGPPVRPAPERVDAEYEVLGDGDEHRR